MKNVLADMIIGDFLFDLIVDVPVAIGISDRGTGVEFDAERTPSGLAF